MTTTAVAYAVIAEEASTAIPVRHASLLAITGAEVLRVVWSGAGIVVAGGLLLITGLRGRRGTGSSR